MDKETIQTEEIKISHNTGRKCRRIIGMVFLGILGLDLLCGTICNFRNCAMLNACIDFPYIREELAVVGVDAEPYDGTGIGQKIGRFVSHEFSTLLGRTWTAALFMGKWDQVSFCQYLLKEQKLIKYVEGAVGFSLVSREPRPSGQMSEPDLRQGLVLLELASEHGFLHSTCALGELYSGFSYLPPEDMPFQPSDEKRAVELLTTATQSEEKMVAGTAFYRLGMMYKRPFSEMHDMDKAIEFMRKAYGLGIHRAAYEIGIHYSDGLKDYATALEWFHKAADANVPDAEFAIGICHQNGWGVDANQDIAVAWFRKAASHGSETAKEYVDRYRRLHPEDAEGMYALAQTYRTGGEGIPIDLPKAVYWLNKAAERNYLLALNALGEMYFYGNGIPRDYFRAYNLWLKAASLGDAVAQRRVGVCYEIGAGCEQDERAMFQWYKSSAEKGDPVDQFKTGDCYQNGRGTDADIREAFAWFEKAAKNGQADGQMRYAGLLLRNIDGTARYHEGLEWLEKSAAAGVPEAQVTMGLCCFAEIKGLELNSSDGGKWFAKVKNNKDTSEETKEAVEAIILSEQLFGKEGLKQQSRLSLQKIFPNLF